MNKPKQCDCHSYNGDFGSTPEVKLPMLVGIRASGEKIYKDVMIDACISSVIQHLWENGVGTSGSCCGHGNMPPSIVLTEGAENYSQIRAWIAEKDERWFELSQWKRVLV